jgi:hypothetical protein
VAKARVDKFGNTREQRLLKENQALKRQLSALRKQIARIDLDRYDSVKDIIEQHYQDEKHEKGQEILENLKQIWKCRECEEGYLEIKVYSKIGQAHYYRQCNECANRTDSQRYDPKTVKGILTNGEK